MLTKLMTVFVRPHVEVHDADADAACPACDHPFGHLNHMCFGPLSNAS